VRSGQYVEALGREEEWIEERLAAHAEPGAPVEQLLPNGRWIRVEERRTESGNIVGFRVDITELKEALRRSEAASAAKSAFLNTVSHELRTPLTVVLGYNAFLGRMEVLPGYARLREAIEAGDTGAAIQRLEELREEVARYAHQIDASGRHLIDLISGILDLAAIEEGALRLETEELQLGPLIAEVAEQLCPLAQRRGLYLKVEEADVVALADPLRVRQILFNIAGNALKFTETGGITIRSGAAADDVWVEVEDTGVGIAPEDMALVFERFGQLDASDARHHGGAGLGLAISRDLAEMQGGSLEVESERGRGSIFRLRLKARQPVALAAE
jgi:signal transduction histidine kinase